MYNECLLKYYYYYYYYVQIELDQWGVITHAATNRKWREGCGPLRKIRSSSTSSPPMAMAAGALFPDLLVFLYLYIYIYIYMHASPFMYIMTMMMMMWVAGLQRCGKSCRLRWINYLRPDLKRGSFSHHEAIAILHLHTVLGNRYYLVDRSCRCYIRLNDFSP